MLDFLLPQIATYNPVNWDRALRNDPFGPDGHRDLVRGRKVRAIQPAPACPEPDSGNSIRGAPYADSYRQWCEGCSVGLWPAAIHSIAHSALIKFVSNPELKLQ